MSPGPRVEALTADTNPLRLFGTRGAWPCRLEGCKSADALKLFDQISSDDGAPRNVRLARAAHVSELIRGSGQRVVIACRPKVRSGFGTNDMQDKR